MIIFAIFAVQNNHLIFGSRKYIHIKEYACRKSILSIHRMVLCIQVAGEFVSKIPKFTVTLMHWIL